MKKTFKRILSVMLVVIVLVGAMPVLHASASDYPLTYLITYNNILSKGDIVRLDFRHYSKFSNEKVLMEIYNSKGERVTYDIAEWSSYSDSPRWCAMAWGTFDCEPGEYTIIVTDYYYSYGYWLEAPNKRSYKFILNDAANFGAADRNKYSGSKTIIRNSKYKKNDLLPNELCTAVSAWDKNKIVNENYSIRLTKMYLGDTAARQVKVDNMYNLLCTPYEHWVYMYFEINNRSSKTIEASDLIGLNTLYRYNGYRIMVNDSAASSYQEYTDASFVKIAPFTTRIVKYAVMLEKDFGLPYIRLKNGNGYTYLNINPDTIDGTKVESHDFRKSKAKKATLTKNGSITYECAVCGEQKEEKIIAPKTFKLSKTSYVYDGKAKKPGVTVIDANGNKISADNYTLTYSKGRKNVGKYSVTINFKGNYSGKKTLYFTVKSK